VVCPTCALEVPAGDVFCRHCGSPLGLDTSSPPGDSDPGESRSPQRTVRSEDRGLGERSITVSQDRDATQTGPGVQSTGPTPVVPDLSAGGNAAPGGHDSAAGGVGSSEPHSARSGAGAAPAVSGRVAQNVLLPRVPFRLAWSPRKPWVLTTKLSESEVATLFSERMTHKANLFRLFNDYFRRARWDVHRNAISGELVASCRPTGLVSVGFGKNKLMVDVSEDQMACMFERSPSGLNEIRVGPKQYTTWFGLYFYPATVYGFDVVKAIKRADRDATVKYPWSPARIVMLVALLGLFLVAETGGSRSNSGSSQAVAVFAPNTESEGSADPGGGASEHTAESSEAPGTPSPSTPRPSPPVRTVESHLKRLGSGDYEGAFALMSEAYRSANPRWILNREVADPEIHISDLGRAQFSRGSARVFVEFYARDRHPTKGSDTKCRLFSGFVGLIEHGGSWRYEPAHNSLSSRTELGLGARCHA
jgi:hypothetical protein